MYYIEKCEFKKIVKKTNRSLFSGFSYLSRLLKRDNLISYREHDSDCNFPVYFWNEIETKESREKQESQIHNEYISRGISKTFKMKNKDRKKIISDSFAQTLGYNNYSDYLSQLRHNKNSLKHINELSCNEILEIDKNFKKELIKNFDFKLKSIFHGFNKYKYISYYYNKVLNGDYSHSDDMAKLVGAAWFLDISAYDGDWDFNPSNIENINNKFHFDYLGDMYEQSNSFKYFSFNSIDEENNTIYDFSFLKGLKYVYQLIDKKDDIQNLSPFIFEKFLKESKYSFSNITVRIIELIREDNMSDPLIKYLIKVNENSLKV